MNKTRPIKAIAPKRRAVRWTLIATGLLTAGAAITLLIAVYGPQLEEGHNIQPQFGVLDTGGNGNRYLTYWRYEVGDSFPAAQPPPSLDELEARAFASKLYGHISWGNRPPTPPGIVYTNRVTNFYRAGWPAHVLRHRSSVLSGNAPGLGWSPARVEEQPMILSGFIINVVFWALATWGLIAVTMRARALLQHMTRRAGHCTQCGYSLAGLDIAAPCPECGKGANTTT